jgi:hypothetical protein
LFDFLSLEAVGGILVVTQQFPPDRMLMKPYIMAFAAPALATLGKVDTTHPPGLSFLDFWDNTVLTPLAGFPTDSALHCPLMVAAEGVSCKVKLLPGIMDFMQDTQPLFFLYGEQVAAFIQLATASHYRP